MLALGTECAVLLTHLTALFACEDMVYGNPSCHDLRTEYVECADPTGCGVGHNGQAWGYQVRHGLNKLPSCVVFFQQRLPWVLQQFLGTCSRTNVSFCFRFVHTTEYENCIERQHASLKSRLCFYC